MRNTLETRLGLFFALAIIAAFLLLELVGGLSFFKKGDTLRTRFNNVQELKSGDPVKMAGVQIGRVEKLGLSTNGVEVSFRVDPSAEVKTDSVATIKFTGLMGQNYLSLDFGSPDAPKAAPNTILQSKEQADLSDLMAKLDNVASGIENVSKSFTGEKIDNLLGPITDFVKQNSPALTATIGNMRTISDKITQGEGTVGRLINEDTLYVSALQTVTNLENTVEITAEELRLTVADARSVLKSAQTTVDNLNSGQGTMGKLMKDERLYNETTDAMTNLREILQKINRGEGSVGQLVNDESLLKNVKLSLQKLDKATESLEDTGPLNVLGTVVGTLF
jgi:phospholipid/cholesterol/gamma-HCH transport system substrate-binding protein